MTLSNEERIARLEAGYEHLATKADVADVRVEVADTRADLKSDISTAQSDTSRRIDRLFWAIMGIGGGLLAVAAAALIRDTLA